jgi:hypothetical protein
MNFSNFGRISDKSGQNDAKRTWPNACLVQKANVLFIHCIVAWPRFGFSTQGEVLTATWNVVEYEFAQAGEATQAQGLAHIAECLCGVRVWCSICPKHF